MAAGTHVREHDDLRGREFRPVVQPLYPADAGRNDGLAARLARQAITPARYILTANAPVAKRARRARDASYRYLSRSKPRVKITLIRFESRGAPERGRNCLINPAAVKSKLIHRGSLRKRTCRVLHLYPARRAG